MEASLYTQIVAYKKNGVLPTEFTSTKGNFKKQAESYKLNKKNYLLRNNKMVVQCAQKEKLFQEFHSTNFFLLCN